MHWCYLAIHYVHLLSVCCSREEYLQREMFYNLRILKKLVLISCCVEHYKLKISLVLAVH